MPKRSSSDENDETSPAFAALEHVIDLTESPAHEVDQLRSTLAELRRLCAEVRDFAKVAQLPERVIDALDLASKGFSAGPSLLPIVAEDFPESPAVALGRQGGLKGGKARADALSARRKREIATLGAQKRWAEHRRRQRKQDK